MDHQQPSQSGYVVPSEAHVVLSGDQAEIMRGNVSSTAIGRLIVHIDDEIIQTLVPKYGHVLIGRSRMCDLRLIPLEVSRHHAIVINSSNGTNLIDLRSRNGTFVDDRPITYYPLQDNNVISIGGCRIRYVTDDV